jgi:hypothetical protein
MAGNRAVSAQAKKSNGDQLVLHHQETDSPILPVAQLEQLHQFRPDLVDFVVKQTVDEANHRRRIESRTNYFIFIERILGQVCAVVVAGAGVGGGIYLGLNGQPALGGTIATAMIVTLGVAFLGKKSPPK